MKKQLVYIFSTIFIIFTFFVIGFYFSVNKELSLEKKVEQENILLDEYNFKQLEKAKTFLMQNSLSGKNFFWLDEFNELSNLDIKPLKDCYYISSSNWEEDYIFWFQLYSNKYKDKYWNDFYAYPRYSIPVEYFCWWSIDCNDDLSLNWFMITIKRPCN